MAKIISYWKNLPPACMAGRKFVDYSFYLAFGLYVAITWLSLTNIPDLIPTYIYSACEVAGQALICLLILIRLLIIYARPIERIATVVLIVFAALVWINAEEAWFLWTTLFVLSSKRVDINKVARLVLIEVIIISSITIMLSCFSLIDTWSAPRTDTGVMRSSMGFIHPNALGSALTVIAITYLFISFKRNTKKPIICGLLLSAVAYIIANSRVAAVVIILSVLLIIAGRIAVRKDLTFQMTTACFVIVMLTIAASVYFLLFYDSGNSIHNSLNSLLSGRLELANYYYNMHKFTIIGYNYPDALHIYLQSGESLNFLVDNAYDHIILRFGWLSAALLIISIVRFYWRSRSCPEKISVIVVLTSFFIFSFCEQLGCQVAGNFALLSFIELLPFTENESQNNR